MTLYSTLHRMPFSLPIASLHQTLAPSTCIRLKGLALSTPRVLHVSGLRPPRRGGKVLFAAHDGVNSGDQATDRSVKKRSIVEHIFLLSAKIDLSEDEEKDMLDHIYTSQYQMSGIVAISLGRVVDPNDNITHAVYMRFQKKGALEKFYDNSYYKGILKGHVIPYCYALIDVDYESEVEDDMLSIFRRGEEFHNGVECIILLSIFETTPGRDIEDALATLENLIEEFRYLIIQATQGSNFNHTSSDYTHSAVIRFPSIDALKLFSESPQFKDMWRFKFQPISKKSLVIHFVVDPVGTEM